MARNRFFEKFPDFFTSSELILSGLIFVACGRHFPDERIQIEMMGFHQILQRVAAVPQLRIEQADEKVGIHVGKFGKVHGGKCGAVPGRSSLPTGPKIQESGGFPL